MFSPDIFSSYCHSPTRFPSQISECSLMLFKAKYVFDIIYIYIYSKCLILNNYFNGKYNFQNTLFDWKEPETLNMFWPWTTSCKEPLKKGLTKLQASCLYFPRISFDLILNWLRNMLKTKYKLHISDQTQLLLVAICFFPFQLHASFPH